MYKKLDSLRQRYYTVINKGKGDIQMKTVKLFSAGELVGLQTVKAKTADEAILKAVAMFQGRGIDYAVCEIADAVI